jgi:hypothetical protein
MSRMLLGIAAVMASGPLVAGRPAFYAFGGKVSQIPYTLVSTGHGGGSEGAGGSGRGGDSSRGGSSDRAGMSSDSSRDDDHPGGVEAGDDHGGVGETEPGDDKGGAGEVEVGDDHGTDARHNTFDYNLASVLIPTEPS